jgi:LPS-assembly protein
VPDLTRRFLRTELKLQTAFSRIFGNLEEAHSNRFKHEIQPEIISTSVPWLDQPYHPFLGFTRTSEIPFFSREAASDSDLNGDNGIQFDYDDRLIDRNLITYRITNKVTQKTWDDMNNVSYNRFLTWRLSQTYDVYEAHRGADHRQPWSDIESILSIRLPHFNTYTKINFFPYQRLSDTSSHLTVNDDRGNYLKVGLTRKYRPDNDGRIDVNERTEDYLFQLGTTAKYVNFAGRIIYNGNDRKAVADGSRVKALTYALIFRPPGNCWGIHFLQHREIATDDVTYKLHFDFLFDGKTSTQSPTKTLESYGF